MKYINAFLDDCLTKKLGYQLSLLVHQQVPGQNSGHFQWKDFAISFRNKIIQKHINVSLFNNLERLDWKNLHWNMAK